MTTGTMTRKMAAEYLGISLPTLDSFLHRQSNPLPSIKAGRRYIIPVEGLETWLAAEAARQTGGGTDA